MKPLRVSEIIVGVVIDQKRRHQGCSYAGGQRVIYGEGGSRPVNAGGEDRVEGNSRTGAENHLLRRPGLRYSTRLCLEHLRLGNPGSKPLHRNVQVIFKSQGDRVFQAQHQLAVLDQLIEPRGICQRRFCHVDRFVGQDEIRKPGLTFRVVRSHMRPQIARVFRRGSASRRLRRGGRLSLGLVLRLRLRLSLLSLGALCLGNRR